MAESKPEVAGEKKSIKLDGANAEEEPKLIKSPKMPESTPDIAAKKKTAKGNDGTDVDPKMIGLFEENLGFAPESNYQGEASGEPDRTKEFRKTAKFKDFESFNSQHHHSIGTGLYLTDEILDLPPRFRAKVIAALENAAALNNIPLIGDPLKMILAETVRNTDKKRDKSDSLVTYSTQKINVENRLEPKPAFNPSSTRTRNASSSSDGSRKGPRSTFGDVRDSPSCAKFAKDRSISRTECNQGFEHSNSCNRFKKPVDPGVTPSSSTLHPRYLPLSDRGRGRNSFQSSSNPNLSKKESTKRNYASGKTKNSFGSCDDSHSTQETSQMLPSDLIASYDGRLVDQEFPIDESGSKTNPDPEKFYENILSAINAYTSSHHPMQDCIKCENNAVSLIQNYNNDHGHHASDLDLSSKYSKSCSYRSKRDDSIKKPISSVSDTSFMVNASCDNLRNFPDHCALKESSKESKNSSGNTSSPCKQIRLSLQDLFGPDFDKKCDNSHEHLPAGRELENDSFPVHETEVGFSSPENNENRLPSFGSRHERSSSNCSHDNNGPKKQSRKKCPKTKLPQNVKEASGKPVHNNAFSKDAASLAKFQRTKIDPTDSEYAAVSPVLSFHGYTGWESPKSSTDLSHLNSRDGKINSPKQGYLKSMSKSAAKNDISAASNQSLRTGKEDNSVNNLNKESVTAKKPNYSKLQNVNSNNIAVTRNIESNLFEDSLYLAQSSRGVASSASMKRVKIDQESWEDDRFCDNVPPHSSKCSSKTFNLSKDSNSKISPEEGTKQQQYSRNFDRRKRTDQEFSRSDSNLHSASSPGEKNLESDLSARKQTRFREHSPSFKQRYSSTKDVKISSNQSGVSRSRNMERFNDTDSVISESSSKHSADSNVNFASRRKSSKKKFQNASMNNVDNSFPKHHFDSEKRPRPKGCVENGFFLKISVSEEKKDLEFWVDTFKQLFPFPFDVEKCCHFSNTLILSFESKHYVVTGHKILCSRKKKGPGSSRHILQISEIKTHVIRPCDCKQAVLSDSTKEIEEKTTVCLKTLSEKVNEVRQSKSAPKTSHRRTQNTEKIAAKDDILKTYNCCKQIFLDFKNFILEKIYASESLRAVQEWKVKFVRECNVFKRCLPIYVKKRDILESVRYNSVSVIKAETGSGKSTQLADYIFHSNVYRGGLVICTQPRKLAAITVAQFVSGQMGSAVGKTVGYDVGMEKKRSEETKVLYMTDYWLLKTCLKKDGLRDVSFIIIDEAHERSLYTDLLLGKLKQLLPERPDLRVIVTSATITNSLFLDYFDVPKASNMPEADINVPGRSYSVEVIWWHETVELGWNYMEASVQKALEIHRKVKEGDILVFLTSPGEAEEAANLFRSRLKAKDEHALLYCLHGKSDSREQMQVFEAASNKKRKIIFATNVAETSVTIPGIKYVVDSGMTKERMYDPKKCKSYLAVNFINKSSAEQRKGRAGRTQSGVCYRLYDETNYRAMAEGAVPELLKSNLQKAVLKIYELGIQPSRFDFIESPPPKAMSNAIDSLEYLGAIENGRLTAFGYKLAKLPLEPQLSKLVLLGIKAGIGYEIIIIAALLSESGKLFLRFEDNREIADMKKKKFCQRGGDLCTFLEVYKRWRAVDIQRRHDWCVENLISSKALNAAYISVNEILYALRQDLGINVFRQFNSEFKNLYERVLFESFSENLCVSSGHPKLGYFSPFLPESFFIHPSSAICNLGIEKPTYLVYSTLMETSRNFLFDVTPISEETIQKAYESGSFTVPLHSLKCLQIAPKVIGPFGESVLVRYILGKGGMKVKELESRIRSFTNSKIHLEVSVDKGLITIYISKRFQEKISKDIYEIVDQALVEMVNEEDIVKMSGTSVHYALSAGGLINDIILPGEYRDLFIQISSADKFSMVENLLKDHGPLLSLSKKSSSHSRKDGHKVEVSVTYKKVEDARNAFSDLSQMQICNVLSKPFLPPVKDGKFVYLLNVSWTRCPCEGYGNVEFNSHLDLISASGTLTATTFYLDDNCVLFQPSYENDKSLYMSNLPPNAEDKVIEKEIKKLIPDIPIKNIRVVRKNSWTTLTVTEGTILEVKRKLQKIFADYTTPGKLIIDVHCPKNIESNWQASVYFDNPEDGEEAFLHLNGKATLDTYKLYITRVLKSRIRSTLRVYLAVAKIMTEILNRSKTAGFCKRSEVEINSEENSVIVDFECTTLPWLIKLKYMLMHLLKGDTKELIGLTKYHFLFSDGLARTIEHISKSTNTLITLDKFKKTISFHGLAEDCKKAQEKIFLLRHDYESRICKVFNVQNSALPNGFLKKLYENYGYDLQQLVDSFKLESAEVKGPKLTLSGPKKAVIEAEQALEKLCQVLFNSKGKSQETSASEEICPICLDCVTYDFIRLEHCGHAACKLCLILQLKAKSFPLGCAKENCGKLIILEDIKRILSCGGNKKTFTAAALQHHLRTNAGKLSCCPSPDCPMIYRVTEESSEFFCPECKNSVCTKCQKTYHYGMTCEMFENCLKDEFYYLKSWIKQNEANCKACPTCHTAIEKNEGCNHMECLNCHQHFCWLCVKPFPGSDKVYEHLPYCPNNQ